ncbi:8157_t:CDS:2, partial [Entrophospora sp. SA101]
MPSVSILPLAVPDKNLNFTAAVTITSHPAGLNPKHYNFASHLKKNNITPQQYAHYKNNQSPQKQLAYFYNKSSVERIDLNYLNFNQPSELILDNYPDLKEIYGESIPNLTQLTITNCSQLERIDINYSKNNQQLILHNLPNLEKLHCYENNLTTLEINNCANLEEIHCQNNQLTQIKLLRVEKLEYLSLTNNNLQQDLSFLSSLVNLNDTDIDSGLEYLPESVKRFYCSVDKRKEVKCQAIYELFANEQGKIETDRDGNIKDFSQKLQAFKDKIWTDNSEIANHKLFSSSSRIVNCHGISQEPQTKNYLMVMDYIKDGDLRKFLQKNQLDFKAISKEENSEFSQQLQAAEEYNKNLPDGLKFPKYQIHSGASYH